MTITDLDSLQSRELPRNGESERRVECRRREYAAGDPIVPENMRRDGKGVGDVSGWSDRNGAFAPLGNLETRKLKDAVFTKTLPDAPDGQYVVAHFDTTFEHKQAAVETVVFSLEKGGSWRVMGTSSGKGKKF